jgi:putative sterol carrier protein
MGFFKDAAEVDEYIGGMFRDAANHPESGPKLKAANVVLRVMYSDPECVMTVVMKDDYKVEFGESDTNPDITLLMRSDTADKFWRGEYNLAIGLAKGQVKAKGPVNKILKLVPLTKPLFPMYREKIAKKDAEVG